ncbi:MAG TPA: aromatic-ring-hydroxylating dioxygenase subunit beta [Novosphingobium sp.]|nr:aromatic-ring-hydroxylating dioxygenase subunit beta [Novosphingobium sp.]
MSDTPPVSLELHHEIEQFYFREARLLDDHALRAWLETIVDPAIRYQVVSREERFRKDRRPAEGGLLYINDENYDVLDMRVRQFESGLQSMLDPIQRLRRFVSNVSAFHAGQDGRYTVHAYGMVMRHRRLYEAEQVVYARRDTLQRDGNGALRVLARCVTLDERVLRNKNILFFL